MKLNKREIFLFRTLVAMIFLLVVNIFIINPINTKISQLQNEKQNIINIKNKIKVVDTIDNNADLYKEKDIVLRIEREISKLVNIEYIDKKRELDENNNNETNIELKVNGTLDQIFNTQEGINKLDLVERIKYIEINKIDDTSIDENEKENKTLENKVECIMTFKVG